MQQFEEATTSGNNLVPSEVNLVEEAIEFASNINPENLPIRSYDANDALIGVQWQGEVNAHDTVHDNPTFRNVVSQQDSILRSVLTPSFSKELQYALEGKVETKKLMDEIRYVWICIYIEHHHLSVYLCALSLSFSHHLCTSNSPSLFFSKHRVLRLSMDDKDTKSNQEVIEYKERLAMYSDMENELKLNLVTKESTIANLIQAQDINAQQITALLLKVEALERQVTTTLPALIVQWQGEVNGLETFPDDPTFRNVVSQQVIEPSEKDILFVSM